MLPEKLIKEHQLYIEKCLKSAMILDMIIQCKYILDGFNLSCGKILIFSPQVSGVTDLWYDGRFLINSKIGWYKYEVCY